MGIESPVTNALVLSLEEQRTVDNFVVESVDALAQANVALRRHGAPEIGAPPATEQMLVLLKREKGSLRASEA
jgi:hypothetical protein